LTEQTKKPVQLPALPGEPVERKTAAHYAPKATTDLSVGVKIGRGRLGGSSMLTYFGERAIHAGRKTMMADGDVRNPMLSLVHPPSSEHGAPRPVSDQTSDGMAWITSTMNLAAQRNSSVLIDLGGGDRVLQDWSADVNFEQMAKALGYSVTGLFFCGPDFDDFTHILSIMEAGYFRPERSLLLLNEGMVGSGRSTDGAFDHILGDRRMEPLIEQGVKTILVPRLTCMAKLKASGLSYHDAIDNKAMANGERFGMAEAFFVKSWMEKLEGRLEDAGVTSWLA
jgi:hypothetical protein